MQKAVATKYLAAAVHLVLAGHPVVRVEPDPSQRGKLVFYFDENATPMFREYQTTLNRLRDRAYDELRALGWL